MKRIILLMFLSFLACGELVAANEISREVKIKVVILGGDRPRPRSEQSWDIVAAELNGILLFINFYETVGKVTITVKNSYGQIVCSHPCDTTFEPVVIMNVPVDKDNYTINIIGDQIEAYGEYYL